MEENQLVETSENVVPEGEVQSEEQKPNIFIRFFAGVKERCRKFIVNLKRRPMNIAFFVLIVSTIVVLCSLGNLSQLGMSAEYSQKMQGTCIFIVTLFSILVLLLFMYSFPKRSKKPKTVMLIVTFVFMAVLIGLDLYLYIVWNNNYNNDLIRTATMEDEAYKTYWWTGTGMQKGVMTFYPGAVGGILAHCILVAVSAVLTATYPLYGKLINKINTRVNVESTEMKEVIDTSEE